MATTDSNQPQLIPLRPYLVFALYQWMVDNQLTPHIVVDINYDGVKVPKDYIHQGQIVLNISPRAVHHWHLDYVMLHFEAQFGEQVHQLSIPISAIVTIYAKENGRGMNFPDQDYDQWRLSDLFKVFAKLDLDDSLFRVKPDFPRREEQGMPVLTVIHGGKKVDTDEEDNSLS